MGPKVRHAGRVLEPLLEQFDGLSRPFFYSTITRLFTVTVKLSETFASLLHVKQLWTCNPNKICPRLTLDQPVAA